MDTFASAKKDNIAILYSTAFWLAIFTIAYNLIEGLISTYFGFEDESLSLFGFGADSFIEVISGIGIAHMVLRIRRNANSPRDNFERTALRITAVAFFTLVAGLTVTSVYNLWTGHRPETTVWGVIIALVSIVVMSLLVYAKERTGKRLNSDAILADAGCTRVCIYMSIVLLAASGIYEMTAIAHIDSIGTLGIAYFAFREGRECLEKSKSDTLCGKGCGC